MIVFPAGTKVWIAGGVTDMRRRQRFLEPVAQPLATLNTLALAVQQGLGRDRMGAKSSASVAARAIAFHYAPLLSEPG